MFDPRSFRSVGAAAIVAGLSAAAAGGPAVAAAGPREAQGGTRVEIVEYRGWKNNLKLSNGQVELIVSLDVGPRILSYRLKEGDNVFAEYPDQLGKSGEDSWMIRGGHRLWVSPEDPARTYVPDNGPVAYAEIGPGHVRLTPKPESSVGLQKEIDLKLDPEGTGVTLVHRVKNVGTQPTDLAIWALSVMAPGGVEVIPLPPSRPHPGGSENARGPEDFAPVTALVLWSYTDLADSRYTLRPDAIVLRQDKDRAATKIGLANTVGAVGYLNGGTLFVKRFAYEPGASYPDRGVNFETYTDQNMLEIETLGPLTRLAPGQAVEHTETWELVGNVPPWVTPEASTKIVLGKLKPR